MKVMANLDIAERRTPQDGRVSLLIDGHEIDLRVVTLPTVYGEAIVARILDSSSAPVGLEQIGMLEKDRISVEAAMARPYGGVLVTGPTGSGKSTTLYSCLAHVNNGTRTIVTVEDPVEYRMDGVKQMAINAKAKMTFAGGLKAIMRADPDIIMVGEIRDGETAHIAVEAALTGHLVLSTLHTRDAPNAVSRLLDMGVEPFLLSSAIDCVVAQRLARKLCDSCKKSIVVEAAVMRTNGFEVGGDVETCQPGGCDRCNGTGYRGRLGIFEILKMDEDIRSLVLRRASADEIAAVAVGKGMKRLREDGLDKIRPRADLARRSAPRHRFRLAASPGLLQTLGDPSGRVLGGCGHDPRMVDAGVLGVGEVLVAVLDQLAGELVGEERDDGAVGAALVDQQRRLDLQVRRVLDVEQLGERREVGAVLEDRLG